MHETGMLTRRGFVVGTGGALAGASAIGTASADGDSLEPDGRVGLVAHRGFAGINPENTVSAFEFASEGDTDDAADRKRADWIELDVYPTCDGEIAVFHDEDLGDLTDTEGVVYELPAEEVFSAEVLESGQTVPSLEESMDVIPQEIGVNIDIKAGSDTVEQGAIADPEAEREEWEWLETVLDIAGEYDNELLLSTFWEGALATVREFEPEIPAAFLFSESISEGLDVTDTYDCEAMNPPLGMIQGTPYFEDEESEDIDLVAEAHERNIPLNVWTINRWHEAERLIDAGVDSLIADYSELLRWGAND